MKTRLRIVSSTTIHRAIISKNLGDKELHDLSRSAGVSAARIKLARWVESNRVQSALVAVILLNAVMLGLET
jgi:hypothetical protein